ncbi:MAG: hypothetical protein ACPG7F_15230 [Aggregatilineales bacterium]
MSDHKPYTKYEQFEREDALRILAAYNNDVTLVAARLNIPARTLRAWRKKYGLPRDESPAESLTDEQLTQMDTKEKFHLLRENMMTTILRLTTDLKSNPYDAYYQALAVARLLDKVLKLDEMLNTVEGVSRIEYVYPDGTAHDIPPVEAFEFSFWEKHNPDVIPEEYYRIAFPERYTDENEEETKSVNTSPDAEEQE